jgi:FAD/FMN-containing dehydrogenase
MISSSLDAFRKALKGDVVTPTDPEYPKAIARWAINNERKAKVVAFVKDAEDVSLTIKYAKKEKLGIAIRGGGHSMNSASSVDGGIVIDLSRHVNTVRIDAEKKLAFVGGGAIWESVDKAAIEHGLATVGGTVNHVSGHATGLFVEFSFRTFLRLVLEGMLHVQPSCCGHLSHLYV